MVIATGKITVPQMIRVGIALELVCAVVVTISIYLFSGVLIG